MSLHFPVAATTPFVSEPGASFLPLWERSEVRVRSIAMGSIDFDTALDPVATARGSDMTKGSVLPAHSRSDTIPACRRRIILMNTF